MERLTEPGRVIIPRVTDLQSFEYAQVYERLREYENAIEAGEFLTYEHAKDHSLLPAFQHIVLAKAFDGTASIHYEKKNESEIEITLHDERGTHLVSLLVRLQGNACRIEHARYLEDYQ